MRESIRIPLSGLAELRLEKYGKFSIRVSHIRNDQGRLSIEGRGIYFNRTLEQGTEAYIRLTYQMKDRGLRSVTVQGVVIHSDNGLFLIRLEPAEPLDGAYQDFLEYLAVVKDLSSSAGESGLTVVP